MHGPMNVKLNRTFGVGANEATLCWKSHMEGRGVDSSGSRWVPVEGSHKYGNELNVFLLSVN